MLRLGWKLIGTSRRIHLLTSNMAAPPPTFSLVALFGAQPPDPHLSLYEAASWSYLIDASSPTPASVRAQLALAANLCHPTSILILEDTGKLRVISLLFQSNKATAFLRTPP
jgi:hypothetical protein